ncbi:MAG TPA: N-acetyl-1-D-myo-inositol-2-amino-2-deoxy-alpha-D-glucopyranoside deacetylase [Streptomyces sp.]|nr:N-acetyl-1-D-myo-inositol-2-amino-2-deoxy-alpha-D-glucopyranoside deacetylase [Streptomyces sp.]
MSDLPARRLLLVHAHPDDETINNGATMAKYAAEGVHVTLVTCTLGEEGEIIPPGLARLAGDRDDALGPHRAGELAAAMAELGVTDHRLLGGEGRYRDSGMLGVPHNHRANAFWQADVDGAAADLVAVIREIRPQVLVTYDPNGGYGHPDHIQAHRVAMRAAGLASEPAFRRDLGEPHSIAKAYWNCVPRSVAETGLEALRASGTGAVADVADLPGVVEDAEAGAVVGGERWGERKAAAMRAHATQIAVHGEAFALSNALLQPLFTREYYRLVRGTAGEPTPETDLFAGVTGVTGAAG